MRNSIRKRKGAAFYITVLLGLGLLYLLIFSSPTPELAVRKSLLIRDPAAALAGRVTEGRIKDDPRYGNLYYAEQTERSYIYVKKSRLGWHVTSSGTGP